MYVDQEGTVTTAPACVSIEQSTLYCCRFTTSNPCMTHGGGSGLCSITHTAFNTQLPYFEFAKHDTPT